MDLGKNIYEFRIPKNLSQGDLAELLDVSRQSVSKWETETAIPDLDKLMKMCDVFDVTLDELTGRMAYAKDDAKTIKVSDRASTFIAQKQIKQCPRSKRSEGVTFMRELLNQARLIS
jgi:transcriptional regulator with XRE-family HTH domain